METFIVLFDIGGKLDRQDAERIEGRVYEIPDQPTVTHLLMNLIEDDLGESGGVSVYTLADFATECNDTDDDGTYINLLEVWVTSVIGKRTKLNLENKK
jgi:hypothetical protein